MSKRKIKLNYCERLFVGYSGVINVYIYGDDGDGEGFRVSYLDGDRLAECDTVRKTFNGALAAAKDWLTKHNGVIDDMNPPKIGLDPVLCD